MSGAPEAAGAPDPGPEPAPTRGWRVARAALWVYAPQLLALALSPVTECSHCVATFWPMFLVLPGFIPLLMFPLPALLPPGSWDEGEPQLSAVPALGQHTDALLAELGLGAAEIAALRAERVV